jgi:glyoxylase-like metal-dependent hydrolase (beta-lactamase superfamily II)
MATAKKKVWILDGGSLVIDRSQVLWHIDVGTPVRFPVYSVLIEHPDGLFMYDAGYDLDHVKAVLPFEQPLQTPGQTIPAQLKACGFDPERVSFVVNSHFHFDHVGGNKYGQPSMIFTGDAAYTYENLERLIVGGFHLDPTASVESLRRLKRLARAHGAQIYPSHEMAPFQSWKKAPGYY